MNYSAETFTKLEKEGKSDVDILMKWMQDSKLFESTKEEQDKARALFDDVKDKSHIKMEEFKCVVSKLAAEQAKSLEEVSKQLAEEGPRLMNAAKVGIEAFKEAMKK
uniref:EF-hand domain-containing protein n=1 Tax=Heliothis virescens TaxID=7102 RepID=A0A2A4K682_HELVI